MQTYSYTPAAPLASFIDVIWFSEAGCFNYANLTLPMLNQELIISFSDKFEVTRPEQVLVQNQTAWLAGMQTRPIKTQTAGRHFTAGVLFKPWGLHALTGINAAELQNQAVDLAAVFGNDAQVLQGQIYGQSNPVAIFATLEQFLLRRLMQKNIPVTLQNSLNRMVAARPEDGLVNRLAAEAGLSVKSLIQLFKKHIGLTPGKFHHLLILQQLLRRLVQPQPEKLTHTAYDADFFDQAHFTHFFRKYTGLTPKAYRHQLQTGNVQPVVPHAIAL